MNASFEGKVALVTGGTRGIGRACAALLAERGAQVAICGRDADKTQQAASELGDKVRGFGCDVADAESVRKLVAEVEAQLGPIALLVNNAGITRDGLLMRMKDADWEEVLAINLNGAFYTCRAAARSMLKQRYGRIVNLSSIVGIHGQSGQCNYSAAKAAIIGFTKAYAQEVASRNITVNCVAPGLIETDMTAGLGEDTTAKIVERVPLARVGTSEDVARAVAFLLSDEASYITGTVLSVDGGLGM